MSKELLKNPSIIVHDFQVAEEVISNYDNHRDIVHYRPEINQWMVKQMKGDSWRLTTENLSSHQDSLRRMATESIERLREDCFLFDIEEEGK